MRRAGFFLLFGLVGAGVAGYAYFDRQARDPERRAAGAVLLPREDFQALRAGVRDWNAMEFQRDEGRDDPRLRERWQRARSELRERWGEVAQRLGRDPLANPRDLRRIFAGAFPYDSQATTDGISSCSRGGTRQVDYELLAPVGYDETRAYPVVLVLCSGSTPEERQEYLRTQWGKTVSFTDTIFVVCHVPSAAATLAQIEGCLGPLGDVQRKFRLDRRRRYLDCGPRMGGFGLRLATYFPSLFAAVVLREPVLPEGLALDSLHGMPLLLVTTEENRAVCGLIERTMQAISPGVVRRLEGPVEGAIDRAIRRIQRPVDPREVWITPNHDRFRRAHWVEIREAERRADGAAPFVQVRANRSARRIEIESAAVRSLVIHLNDALVDLDQEVEFVANGEVVERRRFQRSLDQVVKGAWRKFDPTFLYPVRHELKIPPR